MTQCDYTYREYLRRTWGIGDDGPLAEGLSLRDGRLTLGGQVDLSELVRRYGAPLEVAFCPQVGAQIGRMLGWAAQARQAAGYAGRFIYAYATKANYAAEAVGAALAAGAHYETSAATDVWIARQLWEAGRLSGERYIFCNGSKDAAYLRALLALRAAGHTRVVPIIDDLDELAFYLAQDVPPLLLGVRERRADGGRFGLTPAEIPEAAAMIAESPHRLVLYHAMVGSQIEDAAWWTAQLARSAEAYARLRQVAPSLHMFDFGGGMPTGSYRLDFAFDYQGFLTELMRMLAATCGAYGVPEPDLVGEFGRYTVASHSVYLLEVGAVKAGLPGEPAWYLLNGSLMVALPDMLIMPDQQFVVLPLSGWDAPAAEVRLAGRHTCDSDDCYPRPGRQPLVLPASGRGLVVAVAGVGAYQQALSGRGGAHHCLAPEPRRIVIEEDLDGLVIRDLAPPSPGATIAQLGYPREEWGWLEPLPARASQAALRPRVPQMS